MDRIEHTHNKIVTNCLITLVLLFVSLIPLLFRSQFKIPLVYEYQSYIKFALLILPVMAILGCSRIDLDLDRSRKSGLFVILVGLTMLLVNIHTVYIDVPSNFASKVFNGISNLDWQYAIHTYIMNNDPSGIPHSYRFLPDSMVDLIYYITNDFNYAKLIYRETLMFLMLYAIYYYGSLYYRHEVALLTVLFYAVIYQISLRYYAGQLTDPLSHLSFVLSFIFIELDIFAYFVLTVAIGIMAKETIFVMMIYYLITKANNVKSVIKIVVATIAMLSIIITIRLAIVPKFGYDKISGVDFEHIYNSIRLSKMWVAQVLFTIGIFVPFLILSWKTANRQLQKLTIFLLPILILSNIVFSWFHETRNLIPVAIPMAQLTAEYLLKKPNYEQ
jgi:hypothetical protein